LLSTLIEPVMVTSLAAVVLFFALAIFLPMWKLLKIVGSA
jgi:MSHA biogenesis protein MshG